MIRNTSHLPKSPILFFAAALLILTSCSKPSTYYMKTSDDWNNISEKIADLSDGCQIDSLNIRATQRNSLVSSIYVLCTDVKDDSEFKKNAEYIPSKALEVKGKSKFKKGAKHTYKFDVATLEKYIDAVKKQLPAEYTFNDINGIRYSANPFGEKYYIAMEVLVGPNFEPNDIIEVRTNQGGMSNLMNGNVNVNNLPNEGVSNKYYVITYLVDNGRISVLNAND